MARYPRITGKVFGRTASASGDDPQIGEFGSALTGQYNGTGDVSVIQGNSAWDNGFISCVTPTNQYPPLPEMTGFGKVLSQQICYLLQQGVAEYDSGTEYYTGNWCSYNGNLYIAKSDGFSNKLPTNTTYWNKFTGAPSRNLGEYVTSSLPLTDTTLHLADGSLLSVSDYPEFLSHISSIYVPPTVTNYYCWEYSSGYTPTYYYTTSDTPSVGDDVYRFDVYSGFVLVGKVDSAGAGGMNVEISATGNIRHCERYSSGDRSTTVYSQSYFTSEADWQATYTTYGECGKYVYNSINNTVRIPLVNSYFTNTINQQNLGNLTPASIPNIKGEIPASENVYKSGTPTPTYGAFHLKTTNVVSGKSDNTNFDNDLWEFDASIVSSVYSDSATTVNTQSIKQLVYIVVKK